MKKLLTLTGIASIGVVLALFVACQTTGTTNVVAQKEALLTQSGFKVITVKATTGDQWTCPGQVLSCDVQRKDVLCVSYHDEG